MERSDISEEFNDWEEVQFPLKNENFSSSLPNPHLDMSMGLSKQEDLTLHLEEDCESSEHEVSEESSPLPLPSHLEKELPPKQQMKSDSKLSVMIGEVKTVICAVRRRLSFLCPVVVPAAALAAVIFAFMKVMQGRNRLLLIIREKDQRIRQLLHQIAQMKEILSARRRVPVLRIN